jgi:basic membrane protein A
MKRRFSLIPVSLLIIAGSVLICSQAAAVGEKGVSMVYVGDKGDSSYLEQAYLGLDRAQNDFTFSVRDIRWNITAPLDPVTDPNGTRSDAVIIMGDIMNGYEKEVTSRYPDVPVIIIDGGQVPGTATKSVYFSMYGVSYLAGVLAANRTKTGTIGIIAGVDAPVLRGFTDGFTDGAYQENPEVKVAISYLADDYSGFSMPEKAGEVTSGMYRNGTDVIYQIAGSSGTGVISTAKTLPGMIVFGSDSDQSGLAPGTVVASAVKNLDSVIYSEMKDVFSGSFSPGSTITGLENEGSALILNPGFGNLSSLVEKRRPDAIQKEKRYLASHPR